MIISTRILSSSHVFSGDPIRTFYFPLFPICESQIPCILCVFVPLLLCPFGCNFRSKTLTVKNKNKIFQIFLSPFSATSYKISSPKKMAFFGSKLHTRLSIEALLFCLRRVVLNLNHLDFEFMSINYPTLAHFSLIFALQL